MRTSVMMGATLVLGLGVSRGAAQTGTLLVVNKADATVALVDLRTRAIYATLPTGDSPHEVAVSPDGKTAVVSNYGPADAPGSTLTVIDVPSARVSASIRLGRYHRPHGVAWLPDGTHVMVTAEQDSALLLVNVRTGDVEDAIGTAQALSNMVALAPDGSRAFVANIQSGSVTLVDVRGRRAVWTAPLAPGTEGIAVTPDGSEVWVTSRQGNRVSVLAAPSLDTLATLDASEFPMRVQITPDGKTAAVTCARSSELRLYDVASRRATARIKLKVDRAAQRGTRAAEGYESNTVPIGLVISADGRRAYVANAASDIVTVVDLANARIDGYLPAGREPDGMALSPVVAPSRP